MSMLLLKLPLNIFHVSRLHCRGFIPVKYPGSRYAKSKLKNLDSILNWPKKILISPRAILAIARAYWQFWLKIAHLSFSMATTPLLKIIPSYGLRPRL